MTIKLTPAAIAEIKRLMETQELDPSTTYLRIGIQGHGCTPPYTLEFDTNTDMQDKEFNIEGIIIKILEKNYWYLNGITLDYVPYGVLAGFKIINPNERSGCGCGHSF